MPIPFPRLHIAESVLNRIQNAMEGGNSFGIVPPVAPVVPDATVSGAQIDEQIAATKPQPIAADDPVKQAAADDGMVASSLEGGSPFDGALIGSITGGV